MDPESTTVLERTGIRIAIAGGGTGGHISPAVAVIEELRSRLPVEAIWVGSRDGYERQAAEGLGIPFHAVRTGKLRRYVSPQTVTDSVRVPWGMAQARSILKHWQPDVVFSSGGFVSVPSVIAARSLGFPSLTHEQTAYIGLATRINARFCQTIALSFDRSASFLPRHKANVVVTGNPVRRVVLHGDATAARRHFGLPDDLPVVYVTGGAQGSRFLNRVVFDSLSGLSGDVAVIHQIGPREAHPDIDEGRRRREALPPEVQPRYVPVERTTAEIGHLYAATSLVVGRSGAGTVNELAALSIPSILIPLPGAEEQRQNALYLVERGTATLIPQSDLTPETLTAAVLEVIRNPSALERMSSTCHDARPIRAAAKLADELLVLVGRHRDSLLECRINRVVEG